MNRHRERQNELKLGITIAMFALCSLGSVSDAALSISPSQPAFAFASHPLNTWLAPDSSYLRNNGSASEEFVGAIGEFVSGSDAWTLSAVANGSDEIRAQWSIASNSGPWNDIAAYEQDFEIVADVASGDSVQFYFRILTPTFSTSDEEYSSSLTITANSVAPANILGAASTFGVLAGSTATNTGATTIEGDVGVSPGTSITGIPEGQPTDGAIYPGGEFAEAAQLDLTIAYADLVGRTCDSALSGQDLGGLTLIPGVYCFGTAAVLTGALILDAQGDVNASYVFQIGTTLTTSASSTITLTGGVKAQNVFWQIGSSAVFGANTILEGNLVAFTSITMGANTSVVGRVLALNGAITMDANAITSP